jgi:hypothetical protein
MDGAHWHSGVEPNGDGGTFIVTTGTPDEVYFKTTAGVAFQMHRHTVPAIDMQSGDNCHVVNWNGDAYHEVSDIAEIIADSTGSTLNNKYYNLVFWGTANKTGEYSPLMCNVPSGSYNTLVSAIADTNSYDVTTIPHEFTEDSTIGFLICRLTFRMTGGNTFVLQDTVDLRGVRPGSAGGISAGGGGGITQFPDNVLTIFDSDDITRIMNFDLSSITSGNTRTVTPADADMKILSAVNHDDLTDGGDTTLHDHDGITENNAHRVSDGKDHSDVVLNNTHRASDGKDHSDVVLNNTHRASDGKDHSDVVLNNADRHTRLHAITDISDHSAGNWKVLHSDGSAHIIELALGASGTALVSNGASAAPSFQTVGGGFAAGTKMYFYQAAAPSGWTIDNTLGDAVLAVHGSSSYHGSASGGVRDGSWTMTGISASAGNTGSTSLSAAQSATLDVNTASVHSLAKVNGTYIDYWGTDSNSASAKRIGGTSSNVTDGRRPESRTQSTSNSTHYHSGSTITVTQGSTYRPYANVGIIATKD